MDFLGNHIEALIFCAPKAIKIEDIQSCLSEMFEAEIPLEDIEKGLAGIQEKYSADEFPFEVVKSGGGYQFLTKPAYQASIGILLKQQSKRRLSASAMETLSIIAYKQPVTKSEIEQIRGVNCDYTVQKLLEKDRTFKKKDELIEIFKTKKVSFEKEMAFTCGSGVTACVLGLANSIISGKKPVIYDGSWAEYGLN